MSSFGEAGIFGGFADLKGGFFATAAAFVDVDGLFEGLFTLFEKRRGRRRERVRWMVSWSDNIFIKNRRHGNQMINQCHGQ